MTLLRPAAVLLLVATPVLAQQSPRPANESNSQCEQAAPQQPATPPAQGQDSGTAPGGMGSTAWSGGTGGSHIGTTPSGPTPASPDNQPATAQGLDPTSDRQATPPRPTC